MRLSLRTAGVVVVLVGLLAGCGAQGQGNSVWDSATATPPNPSLSPQRGGGSDVFTVTGTVEAVGNPEGCLLLRPRGGGPPYLLIRGDRTVLTVGSTVTVQGYLLYDYMPPCQQGKPLEVTKAKRAWVLGSDWRPATDRYRTWSQRGIGP